MFLYFVIFVLVCITFVCIYKTISDLEFIILAVALALLFFMMVRGRDDVTEGFEGMSPLSGLNLSAYASKLFDLPRISQDIIIPELDYVIGAVVEEEGSSEQKEGVVIDDTEFLNNKDKDVTINDGNDINGPAMEKLKQDYTNIDEMFKALSKYDEALYNNFVNLY